MAERLTIGAVARRTGVPVPTIRFYTQLLDHVARQRRDIRRQIQELRALEAELDALERHVRHAQQSLPPGRRVADCGFCPLIDETEELHHDT
jgi:DNA-binding transcriptional MerR regulator